MRQLGDRRHHHLDGVALLHPGGAAVRPATPKPALFTRASTATPARVRPSTIAPGGRVREIGRQRARRDARASASSRASARRRSSRRAVSTRFQPRRAYSCANARRCPPTPRDERRSPSSLVIALLYCWLARVAMAVRLSISRHRVSLTGWPRHAILIGMPVTLGSSACSLRRLRGCRVGSSPPRLGGWRARPRGRPGPAAPASRWPRCSAAARLPRRRAGQHDRTRTSATRCDGPPCTRSTARRVSRPEMLDGLDLLVWTCRTSDARLHLRLHDGELPAAAARHASRDRVRPAHPIGGDAVEGPCSSPGTSPSWPVPDPARHG